VRAVRPLVRPGPRRRLRMLETWLWTGPVGHLLGGAVDFATVLARYFRMRLLRRRSAR
jgi:hypothetical protein